MNEQKKKSLDSAIAALEKSFGKGTVMDMDSGPVANIETISTGSISLDGALGVGGLPKGRIIEIFGPESSGKTTLALEAIAQCHKAGGYAAFIDAEHALDIKYAQDLGVDLAKLKLAQPDTGEAALEICDMLVRSGSLDLIIIDSVAALTPKAEIEGDMGDSHMGLQARLMSQAWRKIAGNIKKTNCTVIFINQVRQKIGVVYGNPEVTCGGNALKFYATIRMEIRRTGQIKQGDEILGNSTRVKVIKNKVAPPFKQIIFDLMYGEGVSREGELVDLGVTHDLVDKAGAWYSYGETRIGQGKENAKQYFRDNPEVADELEMKIREVVVPRTVEEKLDKASGE
jgi:recombination protein RecA